MTTTMVVNNKASLTVAELVKSGYTLFQCSLHRHTPGYKGTYQKYVTDDGGKKYFINVEVMNIPQLNQRGDNLEVHVQLNNKEVGTFNIEVLSCQNKTLSAIEAWIENQWKNNSCLYYENY